VVDLVNDVLSKKKYFNPQGLEQFEEALREANVSQNLIGHEDRWRELKDCNRSIPCLQLPLRGLNLRFKSRPSSELLSFCFLVFLGRH
jgi:hypothetical protein